MGGWNATLRIVKLVHDIGKLFGLVTLVLALNYIFFNLLS